jgi:hypothetical protein
MSVPARILTFVVGLALVFGAGLAVGRAVGPDVAPVAEHDDDGDHGGAVGHDGSAHGSGEHDAGGHGGVSLELDRPRVDAGTARTVTFRLLDDDGAAVTSYDEKHERDLHLIVVGVPALRDYQHLHPRLGDDGRWATRMDLAPGRYRVYAVGSTGGEEFVAEATLVVRGERTGPRRVPPVRTVDRVGPYAVALDTAHDGTVTLTVSKDGRPVTDLQPYLGASGHLVVIRRGSLDYLHAHPEDGPPGPAVSFGVEFDEPGVHRLFFDFKHGDLVRTAAFTLRVRAGAGGGGHEY